MLFPEALGEFSVYLWQGGDFVLYTRSGQKFTAKHRQSLHSNGVKEVYVQSSERPQYEQYIERNLGTILLDETLPIKLRSKVFYEASTVVMQDVFDRKLPTTLRARHFNRIAEIVKSSIKFLASDDSLSTVAPFISHDYKTYTHCMHVLHLFRGRVPDLRHDRQRDIRVRPGRAAARRGQGQIPRRILNKRGSLTTGERAVIKEHPVHGVSMCAHLPMTQNTINCILFTTRSWTARAIRPGSRGTTSPCPWRIISMSDVYDALTTERPYAEAMLPYEALTLMRHDMREALDMNVFKRSWPCSAART